MGGHRRADEVLNALKMAGARTSRGSVYNALSALYRAGIVLVADVGAGPAVYEASSRWHHHALCRVCGEVSDVECIVGARPCLSAGESWGTVDEAQVVFRGTCAHCSAKAS
jgi:Fur family ferric uptake transcriptional regulator